MIFIKSTLRLTAGLLLILILNSSNCKNPYAIWEEIKVTNNSDKVLLCEMQFTYPDTALHEYGNPHSRGIEISQGTDEEFILPGSWEDQINNINAAGIATFFFIARDTVTKYGWETVRQNYLILERKEITTAELKNSNWKLSYP